MAILAILSWWGIYEDPPLSNWIAHIFMIHNWDFEWNGAINGVWWTLPVEINFYLALPLLYLLIRKIGIIPFMNLALIAAISYKIMIFPSISPKETAYKVWLFGQLNTRIDLFAYGMLAAYIYKKYYQQLSNQWMANALTAAGIVGIWGVLVYTSNIGGDRIWRGNGFLYFLDSSLGFFIFLLVLGICFNQTFTRRLFYNKIAVYFGNISYSIYLWHVPLLVLIFLNPAIKPHVSGAENYGSMVIAFIAYICATFAIATASFYWVEKPFLRK
jgi:peptidoglycan/LPS O-acetylase OafA/YrhL